MEIRIRTKDALSRTKARQWAILVVILSMMVFPRFFREIIRSNPLNVSKTKLGTSIEAATMEETTKKLKRMGLEPIYNHSITDPWKAELFQRLDRIRVACGELCTMNSLEAISQRSVLQHSISPDPQPFGRIIEPPNCPAIFACKDIDAGDNTTPSIPEEISNYYTLQKTLDVTKDYLRKDIYLGGQAMTSTWTKEHLEELIHQVSLRRCYGTYGVAVTNYVLDRFSKVNMKDKSVLVIGSEKPWLEAMCLHLGAAKVTTLEYGKINSLHPQIVTMTPDAFRTKYLQGELEEFDGVASWSSLEHSGLGRYGDALNPWGDILAVARAWCVTKSGGFLFLGIPTSPQDVIYSNWHRIYGPIRWPMITTNWRLVENFGEKQLPGRHDVYGDVGYIFQKEDVRKPAKKGSLCVHS